MNRKNQFSSQWRERSIALCVGLTVASLGGVAHAASGDEAADFDDPRVTINKPARGACMARLRRTRPIDIEPVAHVLRDVRAPVTGSNDRPHPVRLKGREFTPEPGIDPALLRDVEAARARDEPRVFAIAQRDRYVAIEAWREYAGVGLKFVSYLGDRNWLVELDVSAGAEAVQRAFDAFKAKAMVLPSARDRMGEGLASGRFESWAFDQDTGLLSVAVVVFPGFESGRVERDLAVLDQGGRLTFEGEDLVSLKIKPARLDALMSLPFVRFAEQGPAPEFELLDRARDMVNATTVHGIDTTAVPQAYSGLTGDGVRMSNNEGLGNAVHEDFWNHDSLGNMTTSRCLGGCGGGAHGVMTAGLMLGNGWMSEANGFDVYSKRGMAPEALFDSYSSDNHVSNWSFTQGFGAYGSSARTTDRRIRGDDANGYRHTHVGAVANQGVTAQYGIEKGYYSVYRNAKNEIIVANMRSGDGFWNGSSLGPTRDGRIKPDVGAPGSYGGFPREATQLQLDIDKITVIADGVTREWTFDDSGSDWHEGWGNSPAGAWWSSNGMQSVTQETEGTRTFMRMVIEPPPWGSAFTGRPFMSLSTESDGTQLAIDGGNADFAIIEYRYENEPFWENSVMSFAWFTDWTNTSVDWYSQDYAYGLTTADNTWQTLVIPLSDADDWSGEEIDYIHLRLSAPLQYTAENPDTYGGSSGSSAAAPIVAGAVGLISEQMSNEFGVNLDSYDPSPFWLPAPGIGNPLPSTYKALVIHNATDLIGTPEAGDPDNPDTGQATFYHAGPDYATGYGMLNVQDTVDFVQMEADAYAGTPLRIVENEITSGDGQQYDIIVPFGCQPPLKVTLVWDDYEGDPSSSQVTPKLVNNLDLVLQDPDGNLHYPWSLDLPYIPTNPAEYPGSVEPEPITAADIVPARRDQPNARDNVEQVLVDMPDYGVWKLWVLGSGMGTADQRYSLAIGSP